MELRFPRTTCVALVFVLTFLGMFACFLVTLPSVLAKSVGVIFLIIIVPGVVGAIYRFFFNIPFVLINDAGIEDKRLKIGIIPWEEIHRLEVRRVKGLDYLCVSLHHPDRFTSKYSTRVMRIAKVESGTLPISLANLRPSSRAVKNYLKQYHPLLVE